MSKTKATAELDDLLGIPKAAARQCKLCARPMTIPPTAKNKEFCSSKCRTDWHLARRKQALALLRKEEEGRTE